LSDDESSDDESLDDDLPDDDFFDGGFFDDALPELLDDQPLGDEPLNDEPRDDESSPACAASLVPTHPSRTSNRPIQPDFLMLCPDVVVRRSRPSPTEGVHFHRHWAQAEAFEKLLMQISAFFFSVFADVSLSFYPDFPFAAWTSFLIRLSFEEVLSDLPESTSNVSDFTDLSFYSQISATKKQDSGSHLHN
jgi:hypothetical protein